MILIILFFTFCRVSGVIYQLNDTEYIKMPPVFHLDPYELCIQETGGIYCMVDFDLVSENDSQLLNMIHEYSARKETHFNHSRLHYGICFKKSCDDLKTKTIDLNDLNLVIEKCLNTTFWKEYKLKIRINEDVICNSKDPIYHIETKDICVAVICLCLLIINLAGSVYDLLIVKNNDAGMKWLLCFSIKRNWFKLTDVSRDKIENRIKSFKSFNGMKVITIFLVITIHSLLPFGSSIDNTHYYETIFSKIQYHLLIDGSVMIQTFFIISGCLLSFNLQIFTEKNNVTWKMIPKRIILRWLRLTPPYAVVLAITTTWLRFAGTGPLWQKMIGQEIKDCQRDGWQNMLYINNYFDNTRCMAHTWYLAADMQLFILGMLIMVLTRTDLQRKVVLSVIFVVSMFIAPLHTYFQDLYAHLIITPEVAREYFVKDPTFNNSYKRGHTNVTCYILGLTLGLLIYKLQQKQLNIKRYKKYKYLVWATVPMMVIIILCSSLFYLVGVTPHVIIRAIYAGTYRTVIGLLLFILILGMVFKVETVYRVILEWQGWTSTVRVSYCAYVLHVMLIQILTYSRTTLNHVTIPHVIMSCVGSIAVSFLAAVPLWLLVESPITQLLKTSHDNTKNKTQL
ncbi:PREDICTED: nose resistant to fluoxetine protein 6-like [Papilio xuthus]|uniref:Nose resistant to fluoxetine protein 6-like n=1 Tax=Papilio xuthus TaxID=66420 RepID=A0AAJ6Z095_PAPXU|nr:PREDICTED: nose resistant to fluoxetine protein 6-like [Papilio xuthus]